jgi:hypothetical protein
VDVVTGVELDLEAFTSIRFGQDRRLEEVGRMLCSSATASIKIADRPDLRYFYLEIFVIPWLTGPFSVNMTKLKSNRIMSFV